MDAQEGSKGQYIIGERDIRPVPDPTVLTTAASARLEEMMRTLISTEIMHQTTLFDEKLDGVRMQLAERMTGSTKQFGEKLAKIEAQFEMLSARTAEQKKDTKDALDAALAAQKEAVAAQTASSEKSITKSETATTERIKGVETLLATSTKATDDKITDLKDRVIAIEAVKLGSVEQTANSRASNMDARGNMASIISVVTTM